MNCNEVAEALGSRPLESLAVDMRRGIETHAEQCGECRSALDAERALRADRVPAMPPLDVARLVAQRRGGANVRRARTALRPAVIAVLAVGGAAFAALGGLSTGRFDGDARGAADAPRAERPAVAELSRSPAVTRGGAARSLIDYVDEAEAAAADALRDELMSFPSLPDGDMFALLKVPPSYPPRAAARGLEGHAVVEFTVTSEGDVADPFIVESSDPIFDASALEAVRKAKYKPRVVNGDAIAVGGIRNRFTYVVEHPRQAEAGQGAPAAKSAESEADLTIAEFRALLAPALDCVERSDLVCVETALDEISATYTLAPRQESELARIYGFVFHRLGDYERAIAAYERAARPFEDEVLEGTGNYFAMPWMTAAMIHYERHRYQEALDAAIRYLRAAENPSLADYMFVDRLRQLGAVVR